MFSVVSFLFGCGGGCSQNKRKIKMIYCRPLDRFKPIMDWGLRALDWVKWKEEERKQEQTAQSNVQSIFVELAMSMFCVLCYVPLCTSSYRMNTFRTCIKYYCIAKKKHITVRWLFSVQMMWTHRKFKSYVFVCFPYLWRRCQRSMAYI